MQSDYGNGNNISYVAMSNYKKNPALYVTDQEKYGLDFIQ